MDSTGTREENVFPMVYNEETLSWEFPEKVDQDVVANTDSYAVSHFSINLNGANPKLKLGVNYSLFEDEVACDTAKYCKKSILYNNEEVLCDKDENDDKLIITCGDGYKKIYLKTKNNDGTFTYNYSSNGSVTEGGRHIVISQQVKDDLDNIMNWISSGKENTVRKNNGTELDLVVQTEVVWKYSFLEEWNISQNELKELSVDEIRQRLTKPDDNKYDYLIRYAEELKNRDIKWTPLLGISAPPYILEQMFSSDILHKSHGLPFAPESDVWGKYLQAWVEGFVEQLSDYIGVGEGKIIEEIFICNEMYFTAESYTGEFDYYPKNSDEIDSDGLGKREKALRDFLRNRRSEVLTALNNKGIKNVKVGWKYNPYAFNNVDSEDTGLSLNMLTSLFNDTTHAPDLLGVDIYEGTINKDFKETDTAKGVSGYPNAAPDAARGPAVLLDSSEKFPSLQGGIYFAEYNAMVDGRGFFKADELKDFILTTEREFKVPYWTYFKWNGPDVYHETGAITEEQIIGLCNTFDELSGQSVYEDVSHDNIKIVDIKKCDPYKEAIKDMVGLGVISGHDGPDDQRYFKPDDLVNRAEFAKMVVETAMRINKKFVEPSNVLAYREIFNDEVFQDKPNEELWFDKYMSRLVKEGIISGYPDGFLRPAGPINMVEMLKMIVNTFQLNPNHSCKDIDGNKCEDSGLWWYNLFVTQAKDIIKPITRGSEWASIDIAECEGITEEECEARRKAHPHYYLYDQKVQRRKAAKVLKDVYDYYCEQYPSGCQYCKDHPEECTLVSTEEEQ